MNLEDHVASNRGRLIGLAYRMLGCRADAEDILQDAYLRVSSVDQEDIRSYEALLMTTVTRLCLDQLKSARVQRETYVGPWLPEPILDAAKLSPHSDPETADDVSFALLLTLEKLSPPERAAFLLHDVFDESYSRVAEVLDKSEAACRQLVARARSAIKTHRPIRSGPRAVHADLLQRFMEAARTGDIERLESLLAKDAVAYTDGGGKKSAALAPIHGADNVARFYAGLNRKFERSGSAAEFKTALVNGLPGLIISIDGEVDQTLCIDVDDAHIIAVYVVRNPDKLEAIRDPNDQSVGRRNRENRSHS